MSQTIFEDLVTRESWLESVYLKSKSTNSKNLAMLALKKWDSYIKKNYPEQVESSILHQLKSAQNESKMYQFLNLYIQHLVKQGDAPNSISSYFTHLKSWLRANGIRIVNDDVKQFIQFPKKIKESRKPLTREQIQLLLKYNSKRMRIGLLILVSSGMRLGEMLNVRVCDIDFESNPTKIHLRAQITKGREERDCYISSEASEGLKEFIKNKNPTDPILSDKITQFSVSGFEVQFSEARKKAGLLEKYETTGFYHVNVQAFRAYFMTAATRIVGGDIAHAMIGHHDYLDQYFRLTDTERAQLWLKVEPYVTMNNESRLMKQVNEQNERLKRQDFLEDKVQKLEAKLNRIADQKD